jgi:hypothetical protein
MLTQYANATKNIQQRAWAGESSAPLQSVKVQTYFNSGGRQKYFVVALGVAKADKTGLFKRTGWPWYF